MRSKYHDVLFIAFAASFVISKTLWSHRFMGVAGLNINNVVVYLCLLFFLLRRAMGARVVSPPGWGLAVFVIFCLSLSMFYGVINATLSISLYDGAKLLKNSYLDPIIVYLLCCMFCVDRSDAKRYLLWCVYWYAILNIVSLVGQAHGVNVFAAQSAALEQGRFTGVFGNPNKTSYVLCCALPYVFYFLRTAKRKGMQLALMVVVCVTASTVIYGGSRGGLLGVAFVMIMAPFLMRIEKRYIVAGALVLGVAAAVVVMTGTGSEVPLVERFSGIQGGDIRMVTSNRSRIWAALFDAYVGSAMTIILGYGLGAAEHLGLHADAHNYYLQILVETGIIGACCFVVLVVLYMRGMLRYEFADGLARRAVLLSVMVVFLAWMFSSLNGVLDFIAILVGLGAGLVATSSGDAKLGETASGEIGGYQRDPS